MKVKINGIWYDSTQIQMTIQTDETDREFIEQMASSVTNKNAVVSAFFPAGKYFSNEQILLANESFEDYTRRATLNQAEEKPTQRPPFLGRDIPRELLMNNPAPQNLEITEASRQIIERNKPRHVCNNDARPYEGVNNQGF